MTLTAAVAGQSRTYQVDLGPQATAVPQQDWNNVMAGTTGPQALVDTTGGSSGASLEQLTPFAGAFSSGVLLPQPGSPLDGLSLNPQATRDGLFGTASAGLPVVLQFAGLNPANTYDLIVIGSDVSATEQRTTRVRILGERETSLAVEATGNVSEFASVRGIRPDLTGRLTLSLAPDRTATGDERLVGLNTLVLEETVGGVSPPTLAADTNLLEIRLREGAGLFSLPYSFFASDLQPVAITLSASDDATGADPNWLSIVNAATAGANQFLFVNSNLIGFETRSATVTASAPGYASASFQVRLVHRPSTGYQNILFYGNSYTMGNGTVGQLFRRIAVDAGVPEPWVVQRLRGGSTLAFHATDPGQVAAIEEALPFGETWDVVVMQGQSLEATSTLGNPVNFRARAVDILSNVRQHSPLARACLFQTWARARGHGIYPGVFPAPESMHAELEAGYAGALADLRSTFPVADSVVARAGEVAALMDWDPGIYTADRAHPAVELTLATAMSIFSTIYGTSCCEFEPDFTGSSLLAARLNDWGLDLDDWRWFAGLATRALVPAQRLAPGSDDDLLLLTGVNTAPDACPTADVFLGDLVACSIASPAASLLGPATFLYADLHATGLPPGPNPMFPEIQLGPAAFIVFNVTTLTPSGLNISFPMPVNFAGFSASLQSVSYAPSLATGNFFTMTDAHELRMQ